MLLELIILVLICTAVSIIYSSTDILPLYDDEYEDIIDTMTYFSLTVNLVSFVAVVITSLIVMAVYYAVGFANAIIVSVLILLSFLDMEYKLIPNRFMALFVFSVTLLYTYTDYISIDEFLSRLMTAILIFVALFIIAFVTNGQIGGADIKIFTIIAFMFDVDSFTIFMIIVSVQMIIIFALLYVIGKRKTEIPLIPFITISVILTLIFSEQLISLYLGGYT